MEIRILHAFIYLFVFNLLYDVIFIYFIIPTIHNISILYKYPVTYVFVIIYSM